MQNDVAQSYSVRVAGEKLLFSAAHFIAFADGSCEPLHGHDYRVAVEVRGPLNRSGYVVDFCLLDRLMADILAGLDHRTLVPAAGDEIEVAASAEHVEVRFAERSWKFPAADCVLLPLANTTSETIAGHLATMLLKRLGETLPAEALPAAIKIDICESPGHTASCRVTAGQSVLQQTKQ